MLDQGQVDEFAERGFLVLPRAVPPDVMATAAEAIDELMERDPWLDYDAVRERLE